MTNACQVLWIGSERQECIGASLPHEHGGVPSFLGGANQKRSPFAEEQHLTAGLFEMWQSMLHIKTIGCLTRNWSLGSKLRGGGIVRSGAESEQIEHNDRASNASTEKFSSRFLCRF